MNIPRSAVLKRYGYVFVVLIALMGCVPVAFAQDWMPDANLRTEVRADLGLADNEELTQASMTNLTSLDAPQSEISDLTGLEFATNLTTLVAWGNSISSLTPLTNLTSLTEIRIGDCGNISDVTPLGNLTNLTKLGLQGNNISDVSALSGLVNLTWLRLVRNPVTDFSPLSGLKANIINVDITIPDPDTTRPSVGIEVNSLLQREAFSITITFSKTVSDFVQADLSLTPNTARATVTAWTASEDGTTYTATITPTNSGVVTLYVAPNVADDDADNGNTAATPYSITIDMGVPSVEINPLINDAQLGNVHFGGVDVPIKFSEAVSDFVQADLTLTGNTAGATITAWTVSTDGTTYTAKITPTNSGDVTLSVAADVATDGAGNSNTAATSWTVEFDLDPPTVTLTTGLDWRSPETTIDGVHSRQFFVFIEFSEKITLFRAHQYVPLIEITGGTLQEDPFVNDALDVWTVGVTADADVQEMTFNVDADLAYDSAGNKNTAATELSITEFDLVAPTATAFTVPSGVQTGAFDITVTFSEPIYAEKIILGFYMYDFATGSYISSGGPGYTQSYPQADGTDTVTITITPENGDWWQSNVYIRGYQIGGTYSSAPEYNIKDQVGNLMAFQSLSESVFPRISLIKVSPYDIDEDEDVDIVDVRLVVNALGESGNSITNSRTDIDKDGDVDIDDLIAVINNFDVAAAPPSADISTGLSPDALKALDPILLTETLDAVRLESDGSLKYLQTIALLEHLLAEMRPDETQLLANYPNPFNPETWIPYHLAKSSDVRITIYDLRGSVIRRLELGHLPPGYYTSRNRAAYWDGRNAVGERVASGIYFYQFQADNMSLLRKMLILK